MSGDDFSPLFLPYTVRTRGLFFSESRTRKLKRSVRSNCALFARSLAHVVDCRRGDDEAVVADVRHLGDGQDLVAAGRAREAEPGRGGSSIFRQ